MSSKTHPKPLKSAPNGPAVHIKVAIVEDQPEFRENWTILLDSFPDFKCICSCCSGEEALQLLPDKRPDIVLMDIILPRMSGIECTSKLKGLLPNTQIVILTAMDNQGLVFPALKAGADGYLLKRTKPADLRNALLEVLHGGAPMTGHIARRVIETFREKRDPPQDFQALTSKEEQVLVLLSQGYTNKQLADKLAVSLDTVGTHMRHIFAKLHVNSRTEAVIRYLSRK